MSPLPCPQCQRSDLVRDVPSVYRSQVTTKRTSGTITTIDPSTGAPMMIENNGTSTHVTKTGRQLASPREVGSVTIALGCLNVTVLVLVALGCVGAVIGEAKRGGSGGIIGAVVVSVVVLALLAAPLLIMRFRRRHPSRSLAARRAARDVWLRALYCVRCSGVFFDDKLPPELAQDGLIPVAQFHTALNALGTRLADLHPENYRRPR